MIAGHQWLHRTVGVEAQVGSPSRKARLGWHTYAAVAL